jgi:hypothetical protein
MLAPDTPIKSNTGGSQQQLDAIIAESTVPIFAMRSPRLDGAPSGGAWFDERFAAPGSELALVGQQSCPGLTPGLISLDMVFSWVFS